MLRTTLLAATLGLLAGTAQANVPEPVARFNGSVQSLVKVANLEAEGNPEKLAVCALETRHYFLFLHTSTRRESYVLGPNGCSTDNYYPLTPNALSKLRQDGHLAKAFVPEELPRSERNVLNQSILIGGMFIFVLSIGIADWQRRRGMW